MNEYKAYLHHVVDGDTVDLNIDLGFGIFTRQRIRLASVDTPERGEEGYNEAKEYVKDWFNDPSRDGACLVGTEKKGKFGRWLGWIYDDPFLIESLNSDLLLEGLAEEYRSIYAGG